MAYYLLPSLPITLVRYTYHYRIFAAQIVSLNLCLAKNGGFYFAILPNRESASKQEQPQYLHHSLMRTYFILKKAPASVSVSTMMGTVVLRAQSRCNSHTSCVTVVS